MENTAFGAVQHTDSYIGSGLVIKRGTGILRICILAVLGLLLVKIAYDLLCAMPY